MDKKLALSEESDRWVIPLAGKTVTRVCVDFAFSLEFWETNETLASIRIGGDFRFRQKDGVERVLSAEKDPTQLGCALGIFQQQVESAVAYKSGELELVFSDQSSLFVPPNPHYEAWELSGSGGLLIICLPGGGLAVWE